MRRRSGVLVGGALACAMSLLVAAPVLRADDAPVPSAPRHPHAAELRQRLEQLREHARTLASAAPSGAPPLASATPPLASALGELPSRADLARRWAELGALRHERRQRLRAELSRKFGAGLEDPAAQAELRLHARRVAELARIEFLAQNARQGAARAQLLTRVARLTALETDRHQKRLTQLLAAATNGSASAAPSTPTPPPSREAPP